MPCSQPHPRRTDRIVTDVSVHGGACARSHELCASALKCRGYRVLTRAEYNSIPNDMRRHSVTKLYEFVILVE